MPGVMLMDGSAARLPICSGGTRGSGLSLGVGAPRMRRSTSMPPTRTHEDSLVPVAGVAVEFEVPIVSVELSESVDSERSGGRPANTI